MPSQIVTAANLVITAILQGCLLALCVALTLRLLPAITAATRSIIWIAAFLLMATLPFAMLLRAPAAGQHLVEPARLAPVWAVAIAILWATLVAWHIARLLRGWLQLQRIARTAVPLEPLPEVAALLHHRRPFGTRTPVQLCVSPHVQVPSVAGFFHPRILLPLGLQQTLSAQDLRQIVLHEMQHLHRHDDWTNLLQKLGLALFPLNPALWYVDRRLCQERELACDDGVLLATGDAIPYATCLTNLAAQRLEQRGIFQRTLALTLGAFRRPSELARRVHRILTPGATPTPARRSFAVTLTAATLLAAATTLTHTPRLVTFAAAPVLMADANIPQAPTHFDSATAHVVLTRASLPVPTPRRLNFNRTRRHTRTLLHTRTTLAPQVILLGWHPNDFSAPAFAAPRPTLIDFRYAAVPTPGGWLLIEI